MNLPYRLVSGLLALTLLLGLALPSLAFAQTDQNSSSSGGGWFRDLMGQVMNNGNTAPAQTGNTAPSGGIIDGLLNRWLTQGNSNTSPAPSSGTQPQGGLTGFLNNLFRNHGNSTSDTVPATTPSNSAGLWGSVTNGVGTAVNTVGNAGEAVVNGTLDFVIEHIINNIFTGEGNGGTPAETSTSGGPIDLTPGSNETPSSGEGGNARPDDAAGGGNRNSGGVSIPGASRGTVGNPFSDGTDKNDAASDNDEISPFANPYLFEYDPSSTNNNPSGGGAQER